MRPPKRSSIEAATNGKEEEAASSKNNGATITHGPNSDDTNTDRIVAEAMMREVNELLKIHTPPANQIDLSTIQKFPNSGSNRSVDNPIFNPSSTDGSDTNDSDTSV
mgnify:CR=1 FL=1